MENDIISNNVENSHVSFRFAQRSDIALILEFIKGLSEYEKMANEVVATEALLEEW